MKSHTQCTFIELMDSIVLKCSVFFITMKYENMLDKI